MVVETESSIPDMALYHSYDTHYDLLVKDVDDDGELQIDVNAGENENVWRQVSRRKTKKDKEVDIKNKLLEEDGGKEIHEEIVLIEAKKSGHRRVSPQEVPSCETKNNKTYKCELCNSTLESQGRLNAHVTAMHTAKSNHGCEICDEDFLTESDLKKHVNEEHEAKKRVCEMCDDNFLNYNY